MWLGRDLSVSRAHNDPGIWKAGQNVKTFSNSYENLYMDDFEVTDYDPVFNFIIKEYGGSNMAVGSSKND